MAEGPSSSEIERDLKLLLGIPCPSFDKPANQQVPINADISVHDVSNSHKKQNSLFGEMDEKRISNRLKQKDLSHRQNLQADMYSQEQPTLHNMQRSNIRESHSWKESRKAKQKDVTKGSIFNINPDRKISILKPDHSSNMQERDHGKMDGHNAQNNNGSTSKMCAKVVEMMKSASAEYHLKGNANNSVLKKPEELANEDKVFPLKRRSPKFPDAKYFCRLCEYHCMSDADCLTHIKTEKHQWRKEISIAETKLKKLPKPTLSHLLAIERALDHVYECHGLTKAETQQRQMFVQEVENYLQKDLKGLKLHLYGSSITGFGLKSSDVNIDLETPTGMNLANGLRIVFECLKKSDKYKDVQSDFVTKVPSVYFCSNDSYALKCQITVNSLFAQQTSRLLSIYGAMDETARKLGVAFRFWSKLCHVDCQEEGTLPAYCTALMTVYFLQRCQPAVLPVFLIQTEEARVGHIFELIQKIGQNFRTTNTMGLGELWLELLKFYCQGFDSSRTVISIRHDGKLTRAAKNWRTKRLAIEDPFSTKRNIARSVSGGKIFEYFQDCLVKTCLYFGFPRYQANGKTDSSNYKNKSTSTAKSNSKVTVSQPLNCNRNKEGTVINSKETNSVKLCNSNQDEHLESINDFHEPCKEGGSRQTSYATLQHEKDNTSSVVATLKDFVISEKSNSQKNLEQSQKTLHADQDSAGPLHYIFSIENLSDGKGPAIICSICEKEGHLKNNCPEEELPPLLPLPAMTQESLQLLNDTLLQIPKDFGPTVFDTEERKIIVKGLECLIRERYPEASLHLFGSSCNGFGFQNSDLDICITFGNHPNADGLDCVSIIESLAQKLRENKQLYGVVAITTAKVPIVKFKLKNSNLEGDISLYNTLAQHNTKLLKMYTKIDSRVAILGYALKVFAKVCEIGDASKGSLSSYAYILMLLHYLQQCDPPVIPVLQELHEGEKPVTMVDGWNAWFYDDFDNLKNTWKHYGQNKLSVAELWIGLFIFYTEKFNLQMVVTIRQHSPLTRFEKLWNGKCLAIEDPFDISHNLGVGLSRKMNNYIMKTFINGRNVYGTPVSRIPSGYATPGDYFFDTARLKEGKPPTDRCCRACGKIGHIVKDCHMKKNKARDQNVNMNKKKDESINSPAKYKGNPQMSTAWEKKQVSREYDDYFKQAILQNNKMLKDYKGLPLDKIPVQQSTSTSQAQNPYLYQGHPVILPVRLDQNMRNYKIDDHQPGHNAYMRGSRHPHSSH